MRPTDKDFSSLPLCLETLFLKEAELNLGIALADKYL